MINIEDLIPFMKKGWVAMDEDGTWYWFREKPKRDYNDWYIVSFSHFDYILLSASFDIAPAENWKKSLRKVGR